VAFCGLTMAQVLSDIGKAAQQTVQRTWLISRSISKNFSIHRRILPHPAAPQMIANRIPVVIRAKILRHLKPSVALNMYSHSSLEMQSEAADLMENLVTSVPIIMDNYENHEMQENPGKTNCTLLAPAIGKATPLMIIRTLLSLLFA